jgi:hypothetical protein
MSSKLSKKELDLLIERVLSEWGKGDQGYKLSQIKKGSGRGNHKMSPSWSKGYKGLDKIAAYEPDTEYLAKNDYLSNNFNQSSKALGNVAFRALIAIHKNNSKSGPIVKQILIHILSKNVKFANHLDDVDRDKKIIDYLQANFPGIADDESFKTALMTRYNKHKDSKEHRDFLDYISKKFTEFKQKMPKLYAKFDQTHQATANSFNKASTTNKFKFISKVSKASEESRNKIKDKKDLVAAINKFLSTLGLGDGVGVNDLNKENVPMFYGKDDKLVDYDSEADLKKIATLKEDQNKLEVEDIEAVLSDPSHPQHGKTINFLKRFSIETEGPNPKFSDLDNLLSNKIRQFMQLALTTREKGADTIIGKDSPLPQFATKGVYGSLYGGKTPTVMKRMFETVAGSDPSIESRLNNMKEYIENIDNEDWLKNKGIEYALSSGFVLGYLRDIITSYESATAGFLFENFLALLFSGTKEGLNVQIEDFTFGPNAASLGSAKLYRASATYIDGSTKNTIALLDRGIDTITYIVAIKSEDFDNIDTYVIPIKISKNEKFQLVLTSEDGILLNSDKNVGQMKIDMNLIKQEGTLYKISLLSTVQDQATFNQKVETSLNYAKEGIAETFKKMNNFNIFLTDYITNNRKDNEKTTKGAEAFTEFLSLRQVLFRTFGTEKLGYQDLVQTATKKELSEKKSKKDLDNLIKEVILKRLLK